MIKITKEEAKKIHAVFPDTPVSITNRGKHASQKRRYVEETLAIMRIIADTNTEAAEIVAAHNASRRYRRW